MSIRFIGPPFAEGGQIGKVVGNALRAPGASKLWIATAWAKQSGIGRLRAAAAEFGAAGGTSEVIVGIDEAGATREGLELCLEIFGDVFIYHDPGTRTFHPKIYAVESDDGAVIVVGSGNLTKGGLFTNYEAAFVLEAASDDGPDWAVRDDVRAYFDKLLDAGDAVRPLDEDLIEVLTAEGWVTSEARQNARRSAQSQERGERQRLFGTAVGGLAGAPPPDVAPLPEDEQDEDSALATVISGVEPHEANVLPADELSTDESGADEVETPAGTIGFWKQLSNSDASHTSSPGQIIIPIRYLDFFPPMVNEDELTEVGSGQSAAYFAVHFADGAFSKDLPEARAILYEPAPHHPRPNREIRFTFHDREVFNRLMAGDVLVFSRDGDNYTVERRPYASMGAGHFATLV